MGYKSIEPEISRWKTLDGHMADVALTADAIGVPPAFWENPVDLIGGAPAFMLEAQEVHTCASPRRCS